MRWLKGDNLRDALQVGPFSVESAALIYRVYSA
jgi:hypothetical protein